MIWLRYPLQYLWNGHSLSAANVYRLRLSLDVYLRETLCMPNLFDCILPCLPTVCKRRIVSSMRLRFLVINLSSFNAWVEEPMKAWISLVSFKNLQFLAKSAFCFDEQHGDSCCPLTYVSEKPRFSVFMRTWGWCVPCYTWVSGKLFQRGITFLWPACNLRVGRKSVCLLKCVMVCLMWELGSCLPVLEKLVTTCLLWDFCRCLKDMRFDW